MSALVASPPSSAHGSLFAHASEAESDLDALRSLVADDVRRYDARRSALAADLAPSGGSPFVRRLKAGDSGASFRRKYRCLRPVKRISELERRHSFDQDLLSLKLKRGRACSAQPLCSLDRCGLDVRDQLLTAEEAAALIAHGQGVLDAEGAGARDVGWPYVRVEFMRSAHNGSASGHVLLARVAERLRRVAAETFRLPLERLGHAETLLALRRTPAAGGDAALAAAPGSAYEEETLYHVDESLSRFFHFSSVVWLNEQGRDFDGGEIVFLHNRSWPWLVVEPNVGRTVFFSSGWENVHGVKPVTRGARWALSMVFMVHDELHALAQREQQGLMESVEVTAAGATGASGGGGGAALVGTPSARMPAGRGGLFRERCLKPPDKSYYPLCREAWAATLS